MNESMEIRIEKQLRKAENERVKLRGKKVK